MTNLGPHVTISRPAGAVPSMQRRSTGPANRTRYGLLVIVLTIAATGIAIFDLALFAAGLTS